jgi:hypothetical protein
MRWLKKLKAGPWLICGVGLLALFAALLAMPPKFMRAAPAALLRGRFTSRSDRECDHKSGASPRLIPL